MPRAARTRSAEPGRSRHPGGRDNVIGALTSGSSNSSRPWSGGRGRSSIREPMPDARQEAVQVVNLDLARRRICSKGLRPAQDYAADRVSWAARALLNDDNLMTLASSRCAKSIDERGRRQSETKERTGNGGRGRALASDGVNVVVPARADSLRKGSRMDGGCPATGSCLSRDSPGKRPNGSTPRAQRHC